MNAPSTDGNTDSFRIASATDGDVARVALMTDRDTGRSCGFVSVEMTNTEDGEKAMTALNGAPFGARTVNVNEARPKVERGGGRDRSSSRGGARHGGRW